ncbi:helicase-related protein [uncultured Secundilactobacillus sp.]|uniref:DEAD/DEAH box helicase n=1 Tax=uncultured Secundilactobacillus sp. TaxID=2813935 RepID=UPI0033900B0C
MMIEQLSELYGRQIPSRDVSPSLLTNSAVCRRPAFDGAHCQRCGQSADRRSTTLPNGAIYCPHCIQMGRLTSNDELCTIAEPNQFTSRLPALTWTGVLTALQAECSHRIQAAFEQRQDTLLWAVTGAGKTEMLFPGIAWALEAGLRVAVASPRVDVCLELAPRLQAAFNAVDQVVLYGDMKGAYQYCQLTICTTHQLLRFYHAFDVLVVDEVDAFPFASDPGLKYASEQAKKPNGALLYLTATPSDWLQRAARKGELVMTYLPIRYHGHLLPEIKVVRTRDWRAKMHQGRLPDRLVRQMRENFTHRRRFLLFAPHVADLPALKRALELTFPGETVVTVHAADPERHAKVSRMRSRELNFLVTTTILERGVTFPEIDVFVLGAEDQVFSTAALVQIAGRAGRSASDPDGAVRFYANQLTEVIKTAQQQIKFVNRKARRIQHDSVRPM